jgi:hypothetical protein
MPKSRLVDLPWMTERPILVHNGSTAVRIDTSSLFEGVFEDVLGRA